MAQKVNVLLVDDIDGSAAAETVKFGLDGVWYEIDLSDGHAGQLRALVAPYAEKARKSAGVGRRQSRTRTNAAHRGDSGKIRDWARENGIEVSDRGRVPAGVVARYETANGR
jgi:hypothetical protein